MLEHIKSWLKGVLLSMLDKMSVSNSFSVEPITSPEMERAIALWSAMYENRAPWLNEDTKSMNLAAAIASEISRLTTIELKSTIGGGSERGEYLNDQYQRVISEIRPYIEYGVAKGGLIMKPFVNGGQLVVDFVQADNFIPTSFDSSGFMSGCVFIDKKRAGEKIYTRVERHFMAEQGCIIQNKAFVSFNNSDSLGHEVPLSSVREWADLQPEAIVAGIDRPLFAYFKMPSANTIDPMSPLGVSAYSRAVGMIEQADKQYSRLLWEFESGERALYTDTTAFARDSNGNPILPMKRFYRTLNGQADISGKSLFEDWTPTLREENILNGLNQILRQIEDACGLARGTFSEAPESNAGGAKTATELKIMRQRTYATITDTQNALKVALEQLVWAMDVWATVANLAPAGNFEIGFEFDDSVVTDRQTEFTEKMQLVTAGIMQPWEFRAWYFGENETTAKKAVAASETDMFEGEE